MALVYLENINLLLTFQQPWSFNWTLSMLYILHATCLKSNFGSDLELKIVIGAATDNSSWCVSLGQISGIV